MNQPSEQRLRLVAAAFAMAWGVLFCHVLLDLAWLHAVVLAATVAVAITIEPRTPQRRVVTAVLAAVFMGLGALWACDFGRGSLLVGLDTAASLLIYFRLVARQVRNR